jgi:hypothetical protein
MNKTQVNSNSGGLPTTLAEKSWAFVGLTIQDSLTICFE